MTNSVYYYRNRPPGLYVQPDGFDPETRESWYPGKVVKTLMGGDRRFMGKVEYQEPLPPEGIREFELWPADHLEWCKYQAFLDFREQESLWVYVSYAAALADPEKAKTLEGDATAKIVAFLIEAEVDIEALEKKFKHAATK